MNLPANTEHTKESTPPTSDVDDLDARTRTGVGHHSAAHRVNDGANTRTPRRAPTSGPSGPEPLRALAPPTTANAASAAAAASSGTARSSPAAPPPA